MMLFRAFPAVLVPREHIQYVPELVIPTELRSCPASSTSLRSLGAGPHVLEFSAVELALLEIFFQIFVFIKKQLS